jgi:hypothetical protein
MSAGPFEHELFTIIDDFLDEEDWSALWTHFQLVELLPVSRTSGAWKLCDGAPLGGHELVTPARDVELVHDPDRPRVYPTATPLDAVVTALLGNSAAYERLVGDGWERISARPYVYPAGTALSWHRDDHELYAGAFVYYVHPHWDAHWGGELLLAEDGPRSGEPAIMGHRFATEAYSEELLELGRGSFVAPRPNRLVILSGAAHAVARVSPAAGDHVRASVSGFFLRSAAR